MIIFLYGQDNYRSRQKLIEVTNRYRAVHKSGLNLRYFDCGTSDFQELSDETRQSSMFEEKKLIVVINAFSNAGFKKNFLKNGKSFADSEIILLFYESDKVSKKDPLLSFLKKNAKIQEFTPLRDLNLEKWVGKEFQRLNTKINKEALKMLIFFVGNNLWQMTNEIRKLSSYRNGQTIRENDVELLVKPKIESDIFKTIDALATKDKKRALRLLRIHLEKGDSPLYLFSMVNFQFRNLLMVKDLIEKNISPFSSTQLHPFVIKKSSSLAKKFKLSELIKIYQKILRVDLAMKMGKIETETALELLISEI